MSDQQQTAHENSVEQTDSEVKAEGQSTYVVSSTSSSLSTSTVISVSPSIGCSEINQSQSLQQQPQIEQIQKNNNNQSGETQATTTQRATDINKSAESESVSTSVPQHSINTTTVVNYPTVATLTITDSTPVTTSVTTTTSTTGATGSVTVGSDSETQGEPEATTSQSLNVSSTNMNSHNNNSTSRRSLSALAPLRLTRSIQNSSWRENLSNNWSSVIQEFRPVFQAHNANRAIIANLSNYRIPSTNSNLRYIDSPTSDTNPTQYGSDSYVINLENNSSASNALNAAPGSSGGGAAAALDGPTGVHHHHHQPLSGRPSIADSLRNENHSTFDMDGGASGGNGAGHVHHHHHLTRSFTVRSDNEDSGGENGDVPHEADLSETLAQIPEAASLLNTLSKYVPYLCILLAKSCYDHLDGILDFFALFFTFYHANKTIRQEVVKQNQRSVLPLLRELFYIAVVVAVVGFMLEQKSIPISLLLAIPLNIPEPFTLKSLMFAIGINDLILKLLTVAIKIFFTLLPPSWVDYKGRGRTYLMIESLSQLYRALVTTHPWLLFLLDSYQGTEKIMGVILSGAYIVAKGTDLLQRLKFVKQAFIKLLQKVSFGTVPTKEQIQEAGGICTICHDNFNSPVMLVPCGHVFCEVCIGTWLDRATMCPLCRAKISDDPSFRDGSTTYFIQLY